MAAGGISLDGFRRLLLEALKNSTDEGSTLDFSDKNIAELPIEILDLMKEEVARYGSALASSSCNSRQQIGTWT